MTARERFQETMGYGQPDRAPLLEEGIRDGVLERWRREGLPSGADLAALTPYDRRERIPVDLAPRPGLPGGLLCSHGLAALRRHLDPEDPARLPEDWKARADAWRTREHILELAIHPGFFLAMKAEDWPGVESLLYLIHDSPEQVRGSLEVYGEFLVGMAERIAREVEVDFATFSEPIGGNDRPLLSPRMYRECVLPSYRPVVDALKRGGAGAVVFQSYANPRALLPEVVEAGFDCLWACEANPQAMDYRDIRREFGKELRLIGGIDLDALRQGKQEIRREMRATVPPLLAEGGYIPLADGRVRADIPYPHYLYYRKLLEDLVGA
ncbi:MAG: hypothetical protein IT210_23445 [Armatimonadetes bacterium]|nr:hypothetical protein [Armatimonadota bacterium]